MSAIGLIGTVSLDSIVSESGRKYRQPGGILYQAAVLCGLGEGVHLHARLAEELESEVEDFLTAWKTLDRRGLLRVPGPGNRVRLFYPQRGERTEILESVAPSLEPEGILEDLPSLDFLIMVVNSGYDMTLEGWRRVMESAACPVWLDIHSLCLERKLGAPRAFRAVPEWKDWAEGATYIQANRQEVACLLGRPQSPAEEADIRRFADSALGLGIQGVFITLGREGALVVTPERLKKIPLPERSSVLDTTGCGDVFGAATAARLIRGEAPPSAASYGVELSARAAGVAGVEETYALTRKHKR